MLNLITSGHRLRLNLHICVITLFFTAFLFMSYAKAAADVVNECKLEVDKLCSNSADPKSFKVCLDNNSAKFSVKCKEYLIIIQEMTNLLEKSKEGIPEGRKSNSDEYFYLSAACNSFSTVPCAKISPTAIKEFSGNPSGHQIYYARSDCYKLVAEITLDEKLCGQVKAIQGNSYLRGDKVSKEECLKQILINKKSKNNEPECGILFSMNYKPFLERMGYLPQDFKANPEREKMQWAFEFYDAVKRPDFLKRIDKLPNY